MNTRFRGSRRLSASVTPSSQRRPYRRSTALVPEEDESQVDRYDDFHDKGDSENSEDDEDSDALNEDNDADDLDEELEETVRDIRALGLGSERKEGEDELPFGTAAIAAAAAADARRAAQGHAKKRANPGGGKPSKRHSSSPLDPEYLPEPLPHQIMP